MRVVLQCEKHGEGTIPEDGDVDLYKTDKTEWSLDVAFLECKWCGTGTTWIGTVFVGETKVATMRTTEEDWEMIPF